MIKRGERCTSRGFMNEEKEERENKEKKKMKNTSGTILPYAKGTKKGLFFIE
jgi:hypothetical protein